MKRLFKFCIPKILFLLLVTNIGIRPAALLPTLAAEELARLVIMCTAAIHAGLVRYNQSDKDNNKIFPVNIPEESALTQSALTQSISVARKSDEEVVAELTQAVTTRIGMEYNLSPVNQKRLDNQLHLRKQMFINTMAHNRSRGGHQHKCIAHCGTINQKNFGKILMAFVDWNHPDPVRRMKARVQLSVVGEASQFTFGYGVKKAIVNLQAGCFDKDNKLIDITYDKRLPETMEMFLRKEPHLWVDQDFKRFFDDIKKLGLDDGGSFERLDRKISGKLPVEERKKSRDYKAKFYFFSPSDRREKIFSKAYNNELIRLAVLCEQGQFKEAEAIAKSFGDDPMMNRVINGYCGKSVTEIFLGSINEALQKTKEKRLQAEAQKEAERQEAELKTAAESQSTDQSISTPAPSPLPPKQDDPDKDTKQKQGSEQAKKDKRPKESLGQFRKGHAFDRHGSHNTHELKIKAKNSGRSQGQWLDDVEAENFIAKNLDKTKNGTIKIELPEGLGRVIHPDGTFSPATHAVLVPSGSGVKTAYPVPSNFRIR